MVNYLEDMPFESSFRYKLVDEKDKNVFDKTKSLTDSVNSYYIKGKHFPILVIDTPGFLDTDGIQRDSKITNDISSLFKTKIDQIHCICLVSISALSRLTCSQKYIFQKVLELFGKDIENNIVNFLTFSDGDSPLVLDSIKSEKIPMNFCYKFNNSALFS